jgi:hypothetical protein
MEKYGFIYIWFDRKHKKYYIGSHWGNENDGYICSSGWMNRAYKNRPYDFKRKIIIKIIDRTKLLEEEHKWLSMINEKELKIKYYNLRNHAFGHWTTYPEKVKTISKKISIRTKEAMARPEIRENYLIGLTTRKNRSSEPEVRAKMSASNKGKNTGKDNSKARRMSIEANTGRPLSDAHKEKIKSTTHFKTINSSKIKCVHCDFEGNMGNIARYHNDKCKRKI